MKTAELTGAALDWAVAKCEGVDFSNGGYYNEINNFIVRRSVMGKANWSTNWAQGGPIIEREKLTLMYDDDWKFDPTDPEDNGERWMANTNDVYYEPTQYGATPLIAAMRCYVASKLGGEVEIPQELM